MQDLAADTHGAAVMNTHDEIIIHQAVSHYSLNISERLQRKQWALEKNTLPGV